MEKPTLTLREWVAALRSGEWQQGTGRLCSVGQDGEKRYCCLGVALALQGRLDGKGEDTEKKKAAAHLVPAADFLVEPVANCYCGDFNIRVIEDGDLQSVSSLNDSGYTFSEIADALESTYPQYFTEAK